ncbi:MAG: hypothetical protein AB7E47_10495 [Desulfovibrionaceae bacterium]
MEIRCKCFQRAFYRFIKKSEEIDAVKKLAHSGIVKQESILNALLVLYSVSEDEFDDIQNEEATKRVEQENCLLEQSMWIINNKFQPLLTALFVSFWTAFEAAVCDAIKDWIMYCPGEHIEIEELSKIKIGAAATIQGKEYSSSAITDKILESVKQTNKIGAERVECALSYISLSGRITSDTKKAIAEAHQVRNLILHKSCIVDEKFKKLIPWTEYEIGERYMLTNAKYMYFYGNIYSYIVQLIRRFAKKAKQCGMSEYVDME